MTARKSKKPTPAPATSPRPDATPTQSGLFRRSWFWVAVVLMALASGAGALLWPAWQARRAIAFAQSHLPARPSGGIPDAMAERLTRAEEQVRVSRTALDGLAELGRLYHASGFPAEAETCWRLLIGAQPREARWRYYLADLRRSANDYAGLAELLEQTTELAPDYAPAWLRLAELQFKSGDAAAAQRSYERRLALVPSDPYAILGLARVAQQQGRKEEARQRVEELVKTSPNFAPGRNLLAEMLAAEGAATEATKERWLGREAAKYREADDPWLDELVSWCFNYEQLCIRGTRDFQTRYGDRGKSCFERAIQIQPRSLIAYDLLGSFYLESQDPGRARDVFEKGIREARGAKPPAMFFVNLSRAYRELKLPGEAARVAREGIAQAGEAFELDDALGAALHDMGDKEGAVSAFRAAVARSPNDSNANYNLANALISIGQLDEAIEALHRSLVLRPTYPSSLALLGHIEIDSGRLESALQYLQPAFESHPELAQVREAMAYWHLEAGVRAEEKKDLAEAERNYRQGVTLDPNDPELQSRLGLLCLRQNRFAEALAPLEAYYRLQPGDPQRCLYLGQTYAALGRRDDARRVLSEGAQSARSSGNPTTVKAFEQALDRLR